LIVIGAAFANVVLVPHGVADGATVADGLAVAVALGVAVGDAVGLTVGDGLGVTVGLGVGEAPVQPLITMESTRTPATPAAVALLSQAARHFNWMGCPPAAAGRLTDVRI
jgi:hypothetical protein